MAQQESRAFGALLLLRLLPTAAHAADGLDLSTPAFGELTMQDEGTVTETDYSVQHHSWPTGT